MNFVIHFYDKWNTIHLHVTIHIGFICYIMYMSIKNLKEQKKENVNGELYVNGLYALGAWPRTDLNI